MPYHYFPDISLIYNGFSGDPEKIDWANIV